LPRPEDRELGDEELSILEKQIGVLNNFTQEPLRAPDLQVCDFECIHIIDFCTWCVSLNAYILLNMYILLYMVCVFECIHIIEYMHAHVHSV
jgi:hypothetical protein